MRKMFQAARRKNFEYSAIGVEAMTGLVAYLQRVSCTLMGESLDK